MNIFSAISLSDANHNLQSVMNNIKSLNCSCIANAYENMYREIDWKEISYYHDDIGTDQMMYEATIAKLRPFIGMLLITTHDADFAGEAYVVLSDHLHDFVCNHHELTGSSFFNVDSIIYSSSQRRFFLAHHNGVYADLWFK